VLKKVGKIIDTEQHAIAISKAVFPQLFTPELEFNAPARGMWNIVHTGMLIPESHQIFVCAQGCLRGVILTAAEMNAMDRMSFVTVQENDLFDGSMESKVVEGVTAILDQMAKQPSAVLLFLSCVQLFAGCDSAAIYAELRQRFPEIDFIECLMHPTMRKAGLTPDAFMRKQLYAALEENVSVEKGSIGIIGNDRATAETSELLKFLRGNGFTVRDITYCRSYAEYKQLASCEYFIAYHTVAKAGAEALAQRLNRQFLYMPLSYSFEEIEANYRNLANMLGAGMVDFSKERLEAENSLRTACEKLNDMPIAIDYTATLRNMSLARLLLENKFNVKRIYTDVVIGEEKADFEYLQKNHSGLMLYPTLHPAMRFAVAKPGSGDELLAIGQKAACYTGTRHLVNIVSGGGWYGYDAITQMCNAMVRAAEEFTDTQEVIQLKGWGCASCL